MSRPGAGDRRQGSPRLAPQTAPLPCQAGLRPEHSMVRTRAGPGAWAGVGWYHVHRLAVHDRDEARVRDTPAVQRM